MSHILLTAQLVCDEQAARRRITEAYELEHGHIGRTATRLGVSSRTLYRIIGRTGMRLQGHGRDKGVRSEQAPRPPCGDENCQCDTQEGKAETVCNCYGSGEACNNCATDAAKRHSGDGASTENQ